MSNMAIEQNANSLLTESNIKKHVLPHYGLIDCEVQEVKFKDSTKHRAVYKISSTGNDYCLKKVYYNTKELLFIYSSIEWLYRHDIHVPRILPTLNNSRYVEYKDMLFILTPWVNGFKCDFDQIEHVNLAGKTLGHIHNCSKSFIPILGSEYKSGFNDIDASFNKHFSQIISFSKQAKKYNDSFSKLFLNNFFSSIELAKFSIDISKTINYSNLSISLCHSDFVSKNLIVCNHNLHVIDFDKCKTDYCSFDISYCLRRLMRRDSTLWDLDLAINFIQQYEGHNSLTLDDYKYILSYLAFPQKYWKISRDYYNNIDNCNKKAFVSLLSKSIPYNHSQLNFSYGFKSYIETKFDNKI